MTAKEVATATNLDRFGFFGTFMGWILLKVTKISNMNRQYDKMSHLDGEDFLDAVLEHYQIDYEVPSEDLKRIPKAGPFITVSNHPLGGMDGIVLLKIMLAHRPDYKVMANFLLQRFEPLAQYIFPVNPFENHKEAKSSIAGFKKAMAHIKSGYPMGIFPAGEVSTRKEGKLVVDKPWEKTAIKLIRKAEVPWYPFISTPETVRFFTACPKSATSFARPSCPPRCIRSTSGPLR